MKILVIGGTRHLGRALVARLAARGDQVTVANRGVTPGELPPGVQRIKADLSQPGDLDRALAGRAFDAAVHMIASSTQGAHDVLEVLAGKVGHYLQCGSTGIYAPLSYIPADEEHPTNPPPEFGGFALKLQADEAALQFCGEHSLPVTILRPTNIIGAGDVPIDIWGARNPAFFQRIIDGELISIPNDGRALLQPGYVGDLADAFVAALDRPQMAGIYNISCRYAITLNHYVELLADALGGKPTVEHVPADELIGRHSGSGKLDVSGLLFLCEHMCFSLAKAARDLGYCPQMQPQDSVEENVRWMLDQRIIVKHRD